MYADDFTLLSNSVHELQQMLRNLHRFAELKGLTVNVSKSKVVAFNAQHTDSVRLHFGQHLLEQVSEFKNLGVVFDNSCFACS